jgi:hypothetical protein
LGANVNHEQKMPPLTGLENLFRFRSANGLNHDRVTDVLPDPGRRRDCYFAVLRIGKGRPIYGTLLGSIALPCALSDVLGGYEISGLVLARRLVVQDHGGRFTFARQSFAKCGTWAFTF